VVYFGILVTPVARSFWTLPWNDKIGIKTEAIFVVPYWAVVFIVWLIVPAPLPKSIWTPVCHLIFCMYVSSSPSFPSRPVHSLRIILGF
jgi:hypothetical protein